MKHTQELYWDKIQHEVDCVLPFCAQTNDPAPLFEAEAYFNTEKRIKKISLENYRGNWAILFFYSSDFTFV